MARFGLKALRSAKNLAEAKFQSARTRALFAGLAAHAMIPLEKPQRPPSESSWPCWPTAWAGRSSKAAPRGWPMRWRIAFRDNGGEIRTGITVGSMGDLPRADHYFFDVTPRQLLNMGGLELTENYRRRLSRFRYGPGVCKVGLGPERAPSRGRPKCAGRPAPCTWGAPSRRSTPRYGMPTKGRKCLSRYVVLAQPSLFDPTRAPEGRHTAWAYCHAPHGSGEDMTDLIEERIERLRARFPGAHPGKKQHVPCGHGATQPELRRGGHQRRPAGSLSALQPAGPLAFPLPDLEEEYLHLLVLDAPGGGVHGLCGYYAAKGL